MDRGLFKSFPLSVALRPIFAMLRPSEAVLLGRLVFDGVETLAKVLKDSVTVKPDNGNVLRSLGVGTMSFSP